MTLNLLLIDDSKIVHIGLSAQLESISQDFALHYASNYEEAMNVLKTTSDIKIVYCDTSFYGKDNGPVIAAKIRQNYPELRIIGISSDSNQKLWNGFEFMLKDDLTETYFENLLTELQ